MRLTISNKATLEVFVAIFQLLKSWSNHINIHFETTKISIQAMDKSHICLANIHLSSHWFSDYKSEYNNKISLDSTSFFVIISYALKHDILEICFDKENNGDDPDTLFINLLSDKEKKTSFDHFFEIPLLAVDEEELPIPAVEYDLDFTIESKKLVETLSELLVFGSDLNIVCNENILEFNANGDTGKLKVNIPIDDLVEYSICEDLNINISYSLNHLSKMCSSNKLSNLVTVSISEEYPMSLSYDLGDNSRVLFFIAPKISNNS
jgi:proliferating cell nuclear antigen PCNA